MLKTVLTKYGAVESVASNAGFALFRGVPYAAPPVGELRWRPPEEPQPWKGVRKCDAFGPICPQKPRPLLDETGHEIVRVPNYPYPPQMDEDCLYLNVYTPAETGDERLPVLLYIHGGGLQEHFGSDYEYCGDSFCRHGVVVVTINYRLNVFGYYVHPALTGESGHRASGNYGLMDQIRALRWVRENIAAFGGDPDNISLVGQSGGGRSVQAMCCTPSTKGLFRHASVHSAGGLVTPFGDPGREEMERRGLDFMRLAGSRSIEELRRLPWEVLVDTLAAYNRTHSFREGFNVYADGWILPISTTEAARQGLTHDVDIITGCTLDEGVSTERQRFPFSMIASAEGWAELHRRSGKKPMYLYCFARPQPGDEIGVPHSCDMRYLFGTLAGSWRPYEDADRALSETMGALWSQFLRSGDPNGDGLPRWEPYTETQQVLMLRTEGCAMERLNDLPHIREALEDCLRI